MSLSHSIISTSPKRLSDFKFHFPAGHKPGGEIDSLRLNFLIFIIKF